VNESDKILINKLLLERISLSGICRVGDVSQQWLLAYIKELYTSLPDDLNADLTLPDMPDIEAYSGDRMDEEIGRIEVIKNSIGLQEYIQVPDSEVVIEDTDLNDYYLK
jgi:hypothetical protein